MTTPEPQLLQYPAFGPRLRELREERGVSIRNLARRAGISKASLSAYENAEMVPGLAAAERLAVCVNATVSELLEEQPERTDRNAGGNQVIHRR